MQSDMNAGNLRTKDAIRFEIADTLAEGLAVLDNAWKEMEAFASKKFESDQAITQQTIQGQREIAAEDREDRQAHEIKRDVIKEEERRKTKALEVGAKAAIESDRNASSDN